ncbi:PepSY domain-containing protein [Candidatus Obscuribacterales bacterium]|jgi:uncharacterized membrane protein YkoI|nr:PepSY domain-containing protein [Candidatus Obscuribacterales bacterium]MBX3136959.1 PepSY domain-containing protein [Candidatus Obscuribacterales bacterium]MBX3149843.1 PepSY domain-containing protein [Candidatus Obscuribacterales bacterium]
MKKLLLAAAALLISVNAAYADGDNKVGKNVKIKRAEAEAIALKEVPGTVLDADIEKKKTGIFWYIDVKPADGKVAKKQVRLDANTGAVTEVKVDDDKD